MTRGSVLVIDAGSSRLRCHLFDCEARTVALSAVEWTYLEEPDAPSTAKAFDPRRIWEACCRAVRRCVADAPPDVRPVGCVAVTSQRQAVVFLDAAGHEIYAGPNMDLRAVFEGAALDDGHRERVYRVTGHLPSFFFTPAKLHWFRQHRPDAYGKITTVLTLADWLAWRLTGIAANEVTLAGEAGLLDIGSRQWCNGLLTDLDLPVRTNPLVNSGEVVGEITADAARLTGLDRGVAVTVAGADTQCGLLGMGVSSPGQIGVVAGWSAPVQMVTARPAYSPELRTWVGCHLPDDCWVAESSAGNVGNAYQWLADTLYGDRNDPFADMGSDASAAGLGANGAVSIMGHGAMDMGSVGMTYGGLMFPVPMTTATGSVERKHLARAAVESFAYA
ncbi:MAG: FGGY-family carbohydrate kinase, partial [Chloroflexi bacterium]|nr:FGGY-family carbohydrate kinase [Chloroflexota bacterium]